MELHELEAGLDADFEFHAVVVDVADAEGVGGLSGCQLVDIEGLEGGLGLLVVDGVPLALDHVAHLHLVPPLVLGNDVDRVLLLRFCMRADIRRISKKHCFS
jgi:hypothetical protein